MADIRKLVWCTAATAVTMAVGARLNNAAVAGWYQPVAKGAVHAARWRFSRCLERGLCPYCRLVLSGFDRRTRQTWAGRRQRPVHQPAVNAYLMDVFFLLLRIHRFCPFGRRCPVRAFRLYPAAILRIFASGGRAFCPLPRLAAVCRLAQRRFCLSQWIERKFLISAHKFLWTDDKDCINR